MRYFILVLALLVTGCASYTPSFSSLPSFLRPYKLDIQQGNVVTPKMMLQLRPGMTKAQVSFVMGTPLLTDSFHADRWDYFYQMERDGKIIERRRIVLEFEDNLLKHVRGDVIPTGKNDGSMTVAPLIEPKSNLQLNNKAKTEKDDGKSWLDKLKFWKSDDSAKPAVQPNGESKPEAAPVPVPEAKPEATPEPAPAPEAKPETAPEPAAAPEAAPAPEPEPEATPQPASAPEVKPEATPEPAPAPAPEAKPEVAPEPAPAPEAAPAPEPEPEVAPQPAPAPEVKPEAAPEPAPAPTPEPAPAPAPEAKPAAAPASAAAPETKPAAKPAPEVEKVAPKPKDLPAEDAPDYFERMLEKIGF